MPLIRQGRCSLAVPDKYQVRLWNLADLGLADDQYVYEVTMGVYAVWFGVRETDQTPEDLDGFASWMSWGRDKRKPLRVTISGIAGMMLGDYRTIALCRIWLKRGRDLIEIRCDGPAPAPPEVVQEVRVIIESLEVR